VVDDVVIRNSPIFDSMTDNTDNTPTQ